MRILSVFLFLSFVISSCNTEVDLVGEYKVTPVVYGLLDQSDSLHYIRINKTFLGKGNAFDMALVPDSSYFENVDATITEILANGTTGRIWQLRDTIIDGKNENGVFFAPEQKVYYFATHRFQNNPELSLKPDAKYRLDAVINNGEHIVKSETELVRDVSFSQQPSVTSSFVFIASNGEYRSQPYLWSKGNAKRYNFKLEFHYKEFDVNGVQYNKFFTWNLGEIMAGLTSTISVPLNGELFYQLVKTNIPVDNNIVKREHTHFVITLVAGSEDLHNFISANQPSTSLAQNKPSFTNIEGGIGLFSSRYTLTRVNYFIWPPGINPNNRSLDKRSTRELCMGTYTFNLGFCSSRTDDVTANEPYICD